MELQYHGNYMHTYIPLIGITPKQSGSCVLLQNKATIQATYTALLNIPSLPK